MIIFNKLGLILKERNMAWKDLCNANISTNMPQRFSQNKSVTTDTIDKVCEYLKVQPGDIMEWIESEDKLKEIEIKQQIEFLKKQLADLKGGKL